MATLNGATINADHFNLEATGTSIKTVASQLASDTGNVTDLVGIDPAFGAGWLQGQIYQYLADLLTQAKGLDAFAQSVGQALNQAGQSYLAADQAAHANLTPATPALTAQQRASIAHAERFS